MDCCSAAPISESARRRKIRWTISASALALTLAATPVLAQTALKPADKSSNSTTVEELEVTGTLIKGVAPTGTNVVTVSRDEIVATGVASTNDLLATIPQIGNFATLPTGTPSFAQPTASPTT